MLDQRRAEGAGDGEARGAGGVGRIRHRLREPDVRQPAAAEQQHNLATAGGACPVLLTQQAAHAHCRHADAGESDGPRHERRRAGCVRRRTPPHSRPPRGWQCPVRARTSRCPGHPPSPGRGRLRRSTHSVACWELDYPSTLRAEQKELASRQPAGGVGDGGQPPQLPTQGAAPVGGQQEELWTKKHKQPTISGTAAAQAVRRTRHLWIAFKHLDRRPAECQQPYRLVPGRCGLLPRQARGAQGGRPVHMQH
eukprot:scaffold6123_cov113-Isochrysis_galbana.AAC.7